MLKFVSNLSRKTGKIIAKNRIANTFCFALWKATDTLLFQPIEAAKKAPFIRSRVDMKDFMGIVVAVLVIFSVFPAIYFFGWQTVIPRILISFICGVFITDVGWAIAAKEKDINEGAFVTCMIIPLIFPPLTPLWVIGAASAIAILIRNIFGGVGRNIWNPALLARVIIVVSFAMFAASGWKEPFLEVPTQDSLRYGVDAITSATPLTQYKETGQLTPALDLLLGKTSGCLGETCRISLLVGGLILCLAKVANWRIPLSILVSVALFSYLFNLWGMENIAPPTFQLLSGGLIFGAFFMATDPVTAPYSHFGKWIFGISCGLLIVFLRAFGPFPEAVMFSILVMNLAKIPLDWIIKQFALRMRKGRVASAKAVANRKEAN